MHASSANPSPAADWASFFLLNERALTAYAFSLVRQPADAEDLIQAVLTTMMARRVLPSVPLAYVLTAMRRAAHDRIRRRRSVEALPIGAGADMVFAPEQAAADDREAAAKLMQALGQLPSDEAELLVLRTTAGLSLRDAAGVLGKPLGTVATLHRRALTTLRAVLDEPDQAKEISHAS